MKLYPSEIHLKLLIVLEIDKVTSSPHPLSWRSEKVVNQTYQLPSRYCVVLYSVRLTEQSVTVGSVTLRFYYNSKISGRLPGFYDIW